jgi:hypothetical protein
MTRAALTVTLALLGAGCPKGGEGPNENDRLLAKLQAEKDRQAKEGVDPGPPRPDLSNPAFNTGEDPLAKTAAEPENPVKTLKLPEKIDFQAGKLTVRLNGAETTQSISGGKVKLSTNEQFLRVDLKVKALEAAEFDFSAASVQAGEEVFPIARDVQRVVGTRNLARPLGLGEGVETVLMFELPEAALAKGAVLKLPLTPPLEVPLQ